jgi:hypothetical protein
MGVFVGHHHDDNNCGVYNPRNVADRDIALCLTRRYFLVQHGSH